VVLYSLGAACWFLLWGTPYLAAWLTSRLPAGSSVGWFTGAVQGLNRILDIVNPLAVVEPAWSSGDMGEVGKRLLHLVLIWGSIGVACILVATWRLRAAYIRQLESSGNSTRKRMALRPPVSDDPVRWNEQHVGGVAPLPIFRNVSTVTGLILVGLFSIAISGSVLIGGMPPQPLTLETLRQLPRLVDPVAVAPVFLIQAIAAMIVFSLVVGIRCSGAISGERERQTWEALLLTPLETRALIRDKLWGILYGVLPFVGAYEAPALALSLLGGWVSFLWTVLGLGVTLMAMYYLGAAGLWCSVTSRSSWRSLLWTLAFGYVGGFLIFVVTSPATFIIAAILYVFLQMIESAYGLDFLSAFGGFKPFVFGLFIAACVWLVVLFSTVPNLWFLRGAEKWVADRERIRHWKHEPLAFRRVSR
jgi:hypothetical protein